MDEVAPLPAILEPRGRFAAAQCRGKDRGDAGIRRVARHTRPVDIMISHGRDRAAGHARPVAAIELLRDLAAGVGVSRIERRVLADKRGRKPPPACRAWWFELAGSQVAFRSRRRHDGTMLRTMSDAFA